MFYSVKIKLAEEIDSLDPDGKHYFKRNADLDDRLYRMYDRIKDVGTRLIEAKVEEQAVEAEKLTGDNIYKVLIYFEKLYAVMNGVEWRQLNGQWLKSIKFKLPIIEDEELIPQATIKKYLIV